VAKLIKFVALNNKGNYKALFRYEWALEKNARKLLPTSLMQAVTFVLVFYYGMQHPEGIAWLVFYWLLILFASLSGLSRSFLHVRKGLQLYLFQTVKPTSFFVVRTLSNFIYIFLIGLTGLSLLYLFYGFTPVPIAPLSLLTLLAALGFASLFTFTGLLASTSSNAGVLLPLLSIPLLIPLLMVLFTASEALLQPDAGLGAIVNETLLLAILNILYFLPGYFLFPLLWGE
jgi:heme exporter protein B